MALFPRMRKLPWVHSCLGARSTRMVRFLGVQGFTGRPQRVSCAVAWVPGWWVLQVGMQAGMVQLPGSPVRGAMPGAWHCPQLRFHLTVCQWNTC